MVTVCCYDVVAMGMCEQFSFISHLHELNISETVC